MSVSAKNNTKSNSVACTILAKGLSQLHAAELTSLLAKMDFKIVMKKQNGRTWTVTAYK